MCHAQCAAISTWVAPTAKTYGLEAGKRGEYLHLVRSPLARNDDTPSSTIVIENIKSESIPHKSQKMIVRLYKMNITSRSCDNRYAHSIKFNSLNVKRIEL